MCQLAFQTSQSEMALVVYDPRLKKKKFLIDWFWVWKCVSYLHCQFGLEADQ